MSCETQIKVEKDEEDAEMVNAEMENDGSFEFETDHLALKGNEDYSALLKYIIKLEIQKIKAIKDIEQLAEQKNKALEDPLKFVTDLQKGDVNFPMRQRIAEMPQINWDKYGINGKIEEDETQDTQTEEDKFIVRGRKFTNTKPETFNQLWSCEEQLRLEQLLEIYPEEQTESNRYKKIAEALGTRTQLQVMSRVQKYFAKLARAGLPIPGRHRKIKGVPSNKPRSNLLYKRSTFFPKLQVPIKMEDADFDMGSPMPTQEEENTKRRKIELLSLAREQRLIDMKYPIVQNVAMCVGCKKTEYIGARWTDFAGTDYCTDCVEQLIPEVDLTPIRYY